MKETINKLTERRDKLNKELEKIDRAIDSLRDVCEHKNDDGTSAYVYEGHDSHYDYEVCTICGDDRKV